MSKMGAERKIRKPVRKHPFPRSNSETKHPMPIQTHAPPTKKLSPILYPKPKPSNRTSPYKGKYARVYCPKNAPKKKGNEENKKVCAWERCFSVRKRHNMQASVKYPEIFQKK